MLQLGLANECYIAIHVRLAMTQSALHAYNARSQVVSSIKGTLIESLNARNFM